MKKIILCFGLLVVSVSLFSDSTTTRLGLTKPSVGTAGWAAKTNNNADIIDSGVAVLGVQNTFTSTNTFTGPVTITSSATLSGATSLSSTTVTGPLTAPTITGATSISGLLTLPAGLSALNVSVSTSNDNRGALFFAAPNDFNHALFNNRQNIDGTAGLDSMKWNEPSGWNFRLGANSSRTKGLLLDSDRVLTYLGSITGARTTFGAALNEDLNNPITYPNSGGSAIAESLFVTPDGTTCWDFYTNNANSHVYFATAVDPKCQSWTLDNGGAALDATNAPLAGYTFYTQVLKSGATYYMTASTGVAAVALFQSTDGGHWSRYQTPDILTVAGTGHNFTNVAIAVDGSNVWHMLVEDYSGSSPFAHIYYSSAAFSASMNFDTNFHSTPVFAGNTGNPVLIYVPDRNALLAIYGDINTANWTLKAKYASLSSNLGLAASWVDAPGFFRHEPGVDLTDPAIVFSTSPERGWGVMLHYNYAQFKAHAAYGNVTLDEFYDLVTAPTTGTDTVRMNLTGRMEADAYDVGHFGLGQVRADALGRLGFYTGPGYASGSLAETVLISSFTPTASDIPSGSGGIATPSIAMTSATVNALTASMVVVSDSTKRLASSSVTSTTLGFLDATSSVQGQLDAKAPINNAAFTGTFDVSNTNDTDYDPQATFLTSNLSSTKRKTLVWGKANSANSSGYLSYIYNSTADSQKIGMGFNGDAEAFFYQRTGAVRWTGYGAGAATFDASGNITSVSDERLKDVQAPFTRGLVDLLKVNPIAYRWKASSGMETANTYHGFSAQNLRAAMPEIVFLGKNGYYSFEDRGVAAALVNAVKELAAKVDALQKRVDALKAGK